MTLRKIVNEVVMSKIKKELNGMSDIQKIIYYNYIIQQSRIQMEMLRREYYEEFGK